MRNEPRVVPFGEIRAVGERFGFRGALAFYPGCGNEALLGPTIATAVPVTMFLGSDDEKWRRRFANMLPSGELFQQTLGAALVLAFGGLVIVRHAVVRPFIEALLRDPERYAAMSRAHNPYGDGHAAERIARHLEGARETILRDRPSLIVELLTGAHPFAGRAAVQQLIAAHLTEVPAPIANSIVNTAYATSHETSGCQLA